MKTVPKLGQLGSGYVPLMPRTLLLPHVLLLLLLLLPAFECNTVRTKSVFQKEKISIEIGSGSGSRTGTSTNATAVTEVTEIDTNCADDEYYAFHNLEHYSCKWARDDPGVRCLLVDNYNHVTVRDKCQTSCNNCGIRFDNSTRSNSSNNSSHSNSSVISINEEDSTGTMNNNSNGNDNSTVSLPKRNQQTIEKRSRKERKAQVGLPCKSNSDCKSKICRENVCFASEECKSIKHIDGQQFRKNVINLVFVGSGFHSLDEWRREVARAFTAFDAFEFFGFDNPRYNAFYVDEYDSDGFCQFNCEGVSSLLCCDVQAARNISKNCFPAGPNLQTIVIENDERYGGGGYRYQNLATTSKHQLGPLVTVHELGHSLFELGDEYDNSLFTSKSGPNCDVKGCPKWADLDTHLGGGLCEVKGCQGGNFYLGESSFMDDLNSPVGHVNLRYTCCSYLALTKGVPPYCEKYDFGDGLLKYCQKDYQGYGGADIYISDDEGEGRSTITETNENEFTGKKFTVATSPILLTVNLEDDSFTLETLQEGPVLIQRRQFRGDYPNLHTVCDSLLKRIIEIKIEFDSGERKTLYFSESDTVEVPTPSSINETDITVEATTLDIIVEARSGLVVDLLVESIEITLWIRIRTWLSYFFHQVFGWL